RRSPAFAPRRSGQRGSGAATGSIGSVVIPRERTRVMSRDCNGAAQKHPPQAHTAMRGGAAVGLEGLPSCRCPDRLATGGDRLQPRLDPRPQLVGQGSVAERLGPALTRGLGPPDKLHERAGFRGIVVLLVKQEPGE